MALNKPEKDFFTQLAHKNKSGKPLSEITLAESRTNIASTFWLVDTHDVVPVVEKTATVRDHFQINFKIYNHHLPSETPTLFYLMGNGYIYDLYQLNAAICLRFAQKAPIKIIIANARLAPDYPLPISIDDQFDTVKYILSRAKELNIQNGRISLVGFCTGASCAVALTQMAMETKIFTVDQLILLNGIYDLVARNEDYLEYENADISISRELLEFIYNQQNLSPQDKKNPLYSPIYYSYTPAFPHTTVIVAEYDRNRGSSESFYQKLRQYHVLVKKVVLTGQTHNTIIFNDKIKDSIDPVDVILREFMQYQEGSEGSEACRV